MQEAERRTQDVREALQRIEDTKAEYKKLQQEVADTEARNGELVVGLKVRTGPFSTRSTPEKAARCVF